MIINWKTREREGEEKKVEDKNIILLTSVI